MMILQVNQLTQYNKPEIKNKRDEQWPLGI